MNVSLARSNIIMFGKTSCPYCRAAKETAECLRDNKRIASFEFRDLASKDAEQTMQTRAYRTVPQIFVGDVFIGGNSDFQRMVEEQFGSKCAR